MKIDASTPEEYLNNIHEDRKEPMRKLRDTIKENLPDGFEETMSYDMIGYVVPHRIYPSGYHVNPDLPLPFINIASQKNFIALYHMGIYANDKILKWFTEEVPKHSKYKLDMGKSCIRFKKPDAIPFELIGELCQKISVEDWVDLVSNTIRSR